MHKLFNSSRKKYFISGVISTAFVLLLVAACPFVCLSVKAAALTSVIENQAERDEIYQGRLLITDAGIDVALYNVDRYITQPELQQQIVDCEDAAVSITFWPEKCVWGDHRSQTFSALDKIVAGQSLAQIMKGDNVETYICTGTGTGQNLGTSLIDENGQSLELKNADAYAISCNDSKGVNILYTTWSKVLPGKTQ